jgi:transposase
MKNTQMKTKKSELMPKLQTIPVNLTEIQFKEFVLPSLSIGCRGPRCEIPLHKVFNYILYLLHTGMQWYNLPIEKNAQGEREIHYTRVFRIYQRWVNDGSLDQIFKSSVLKLHQNNSLDLSVLQGDGSLTTAKKGGDLLGYSGHKHFKGEKVVAVVDRNVNVITPYTRAPANKNESPLFTNALFNIKKMAKSIGSSIIGSFMSLDGGYDSRTNRKMIFNASMVPNIPENKRNRKKTKRGKKRFFSAALFQERFQTIERLFAWEDKFKRLLLRFERKSANHFGMKLIAYAMINLRHFCHS